MKRNRLLPGIRDENFNGRLFDYQGVGHNFPQILNLYVRKVVFLNHGLDLSMTAVAGNYNKTGSAVFYLLYFPSRIILTLMIKSGKHESSSASATILADPAGLKVYPV
jgi:hypothetical protein